MRQKSQGKIPQAVGETYNFLNIRPDAKHVRPGEYCNECGARCKKKRHRKLGRKFLCSKCLMKASHGEIEEIDDEN